MAKRESTLAGLVLQHGSTSEHDSSPSDVIVTVEDKEFHCHRDVLVFASEYFRAAFTTDMKEAREGKIELHDVDKTTFATLLDCMNGEQYILTEENFFDIWIAADMLGINSPIPYCEQLMKTTLSIQNAISYLSKVRGYIRDPKQHVLEFICKNIESDEIYLHNVSLHKDEVKFILENDSTKLSENEVIDFLFRWVEGQNQSGTDSQVDNGQTSRDLQIENTSSEVNTPETDCFSELLGCTRYMLITDSYLHGILWQHHLVQGNPKCESIIRKILWYQSQPQLRQSWCPPAAIHRHDDLLTNVLVICKRDKGEYSLLDLKTWARASSNFDTSSRSYPILCSDSKIYMCGRNTISLYLPESQDCLIAEISPRYSFFRIIWNELNSFYFNTETGELFNSQTTNFSTLHLTKNKAIHQEMRITKPQLKGVSIKEITFLGPTCVVFFGRDDLDNYSILCSDPVGRRHSLYPNQLGSKSKLVTFSNEKEVFVLQENGCLWRMRQNKRNFLEIDLSLELVLWDGEVSLLGAVLYNDKLLVVGEFPKGFEILVNSMDGVFRGVRKIIYVLPSIPNRGGYQFKGQFISQCWNPEFKNTCSLVSLAALPKSMLN